ncbi:RNA repair domain-containing protein [Streptomyces sp. NPDC059695]|uniref:RNA repair domain-containing protein n=1 Tax=Streptomyces sp. NPDC059695 TaxID=3346910 RepID=UPI0036A6E727
MHTSDEVYHRVLWDPRFDPERFVRGIAERGAPPKRVLLGDFVPGGEIPWHRVVFFEADGQVVWDRASGVDRLGETLLGQDGPVPAPEPGDVLVVPPTNRSAVAWLPPRRLRPPIQHLRRAHDRQVHRWPPHVNVLFGFVPEAEFARALPLVAAALAETGPAVRIGVSRLHPAPVPRPFPGPRLLARQVEALLGPMTARVDELAVLSRRGEEPMRVRARVALGSGDVRTPEGPDLPDGLAPPAPLPRSRAGQNGPHDR